MPDPERSSVFTPEFIAEKRAADNRRNRYTTVVFQDEEQWARFLEYAYHDFKGAEGLAFTNSALPMSARVGPDLLEATHSIFPMRLVTHEEEQNYLASLQGDRPFHPDTFKDRHIPAVGHFRRRTP